MSPTDHPALLSALLLALCCCRAVVHYFIIFLDLVGTVVVVCLYLPNHEVLKYT